MECFVSPLCPHRLMEPGGHVPLISGLIVLGCVGSSWEYWGAGWPAPAPVGRSED